ncbi:36886_t:CDS:1, partial [Gigaspora margarita]
MVEKYRDKSDNKVEVDFEEVRSGDTKWIRLGTKDIRIVMVLDSKM